MRHPLDGVRAKLGRAKKHLDELGTDISDRWQAKEYGVRVEEDPTTGKHIEYVFVPYELRLRWGLQIGDVVHNTRAALDHLVRQLVELNGCAPNNKTAFPIYLHRSHYGNDRVKLVLAGVPKKAVAIIEELSPDGAEEDPLWVLKVLDDADKHNLITPTVSAAHVTEIRMLTAESFKFIEPVALLEGIEDGADMMEFTPLPKYESHVKMQWGNPPTVAFAIAGPGKGQSVLELLSNLLAYVESAVIPRFELDAIPARIPEWVEPPHRTPPA